MQTNKPSISKQIQSAQTSMTTNISHESIINNMNEVSSIKSIKINRKPRKKDTMTSMENIEMSTPFKNIKLRNMKSQRYIHQRAKSITEIIGEIENIKKDPDYQESGIINDMDDIIKSTLHESKSNDTTANVEINKNENIDNYPWNYYKNIALNLCHHTYNYYYGPTIEEEVKSINENIQNLLVEIDSNYYGCFFNLHC